MKKYIIFSDIHGNRTAFNKLLPLINENDGVIFAGDGANTFATFECESEFFGVLGNNDYCDLPEKIVFSAEGHKIFVTHGHLYDVRRGVDLLLTEAKRENCDVVIFGHTHKPEVFSRDGVTFINPGSCGKYVLQKTFAYLILSEKKVFAVINDETLKNC